MAPSSWTYESLKQAVRGMPLPLVLVDLERFDANVRSFSERAANAGKTIRVASKSIRVPGLLQRALKIGGPTMHGLLSYNAREACYLAAAGFDDLLVAYPTVEPTEIAAVAHAITSGKNICLTV